jgi:hypothetical protein
MTSNINPNNIDTTYPIAGQDNDSQGFRDNFTNIKTNFEYAETEIDDLQAKGIFKSALTGTTLDNDMAGALVKNMKTQGFRSTRIALTPSAAATATIDFSTASHYTVAIDGSATLAFSNIPATGNAWALNVRIDAGIGETLTLPATVTNTSGIQGYSANVITFAAAGDYEFLFTGDTGQSGSIYISERSRPRTNFMNPINLASSDSVAAGAACSLATTTSYFTTSGTETGTTLAAGVEGQIKILIMLGSAGNSRAVTVTDAGWKSTGSGTGVATFNAVGEACTLQYVNNKWYAIGNNGVAFSDS